MSIFGFISTSTSEKIAISFANDDISDPKKCNHKHATVYHIKWTYGLYKCWYYDGDSSAYTEEKEILLVDGMNF
jgi:hypothetical protein